MDARGALRWAARRLEEEGIEDASLESEVLLRELLGISRARLYSSPGDRLAPRRRQEYLNLIQRRLQGEPTAYITGHREFYGLDFLVDSRVLVPRPESELLVELALGFADEKGLSSSSCVVADIGTGSGALAVALAKNLPGARVYATDISMEALRVAEVNCLRHGVGDRVTLLCGDLLGLLPGRADIVLCNPPYVKESDFAALPTEVRDYEPRLALYGGVDGLDAIRRLLAQAQHRLRPGGALLVEVGYDQGSEAVRLARQLYPDAEIDTGRDLAGIERVLEVRIPQTSEERTPAVHASTCSA